MKTLIATKTSETFIEMSSDKDLKELYEIISKDEDFILQWNEGTVRLSELIICNNISAKVKNGEIKLYSKQAGK